jgi:hypothetical protein
LLRCFYGGDRIRGPGINQPSTPGARPAYAGALMQIFPPIVPAPPTADALAPRTFYAPRTPGGWAAIAWHPLAATGAAVLAGLAADGLAVELWRGPAADAPAALARALDLHATG